MKTGPLGYPDLHRLNAAVGWLELGVLDESEAELQSLSRTAKKHPECRHIEWRLRVERRDWDASLAIARQIVVESPDSPVGWIDRSYSLHKMDRTREAMKELVPAFDRFPSESIVPYNLACYACRLEDLEEAFRWFQRAVKRGDKRTLVKMAMADPDLEGLRDRLSSLGGN